MTANTNAGAPTLAVNVTSPNYIVRTGSRQKISQNIPSHEQLMAIKRKKKVSIKTFFLIYVLQFHNLHLLTES